MIEKNLSTKTQITWVKIELVFEEKDDCCTSVCIRVLVMSIHSRWNWKQDTPWGTIINRYDTNSSVWLSLVFKQRTNLRIMKPLTLKCLYWMGPLNGFNFSDIQNQFPSHYKYEYPKHNQATLTSLLILPKETVVIIAK